MAQAKIKVVCDGDWAETIPVRDLQPGDAVLVMIGDDGVKVYNATDEALNVSDMELIAKCNPYHSPAEGEPGEG